MASTKRKEPMQIPSAVWFSLFFLGGVALWVFHLPGMPLVWLGLLVGGLTAQYPQTQRRTDPPDPKKLATYQYWKNILAGLSPWQGGTKVKEQPWLTIWRLDWWASIAVGLIVSMNQPKWVAVNLLFSFMAVHAYAYAKDRKVDKRHPYQGVSLRSFFQKAKNWQRIIVITLTAVSLPVLIILAYLLYVSWTAAFAIPMTLMVLLVWLMDKRRQSASWRQLVQWQKTLDGWIEPEDSPMKKPWKNARVTQVETYGEQDNPCTVLRVRFNAGITQVQKSGVEAVTPMASESGYGFVTLMGAQKPKSQSFDPNCVRLALGHDSSCIPDVSLKKAGEKTASLVADLAYAQTAETWHKIGPLVKAHDVSAEEGDEARAAWLLTFISPPSGGEELSRIGLDWMANDPNPMTWLQLPIYVDLSDEFHLAAEEDVPLSDDGNKWRPKNVSTSKPRFQDYVDVGRRFKNEQAVWESITKNKSAKFNLPAPNYDAEKSFIGDGYRIHWMPLSLQPPTTAADLARLDLRPLNPSATYIGIMDTSGPNGSSALLVWTTGAAPTRIDQLTGTRAAHRTLANAIAYRALLDVTQTTGHVDVTDCTNEGKNTAIWHMCIDVANGATIQDMRQKTARILSTMGAAHAYWNWVSASRAILWVTGEDSFLSPEDISHWLHPQRQKQLIELALSESWGAARVTDSQGRAPTVVNLGVLPHNRNVIKARFELPGGLSMRTVELREDQFLTSANYAYGRILPRGDEHGATLYDMILAKHSPFPSNVSADWQYATQQCDDRTFPFGVDDLGEPIVWNVTHTPHIAVMGRSGTGKSSAAQVLVAEALLKGYQIIIVDPEKGANDFAQWAKPRALAFVGRDQMREVEAVFKWLGQEMGRRVNTLAQHGVGNITELPADERPQRILVVFDEFNSWLGKRSPTTPNPLHDTSIDNANAEVNAINTSINRAFSEMAKIAVQGRTAGINMVLGAQRISMDDFKKFNNGNAFFRTLGRLLLGLDSTAGVVGATNLTEANRLQRSMRDSNGEIPTGRGIYESAEGKLSAVQTWYAGGQDKLEELVAQIPPVTPIDLSPYMPAETRKLGEMKQEEAEKIIQQNENKADEQELASAEELDW